MKYGTIQLSDTPLWRTRKSHYLRKQLVTELGKTNLSEFFTQHVEPIDVSLNKISCSLIERLTRYKWKQKVILYFELRIGQSENGVVPFFTIGQTWIVTADCNTSVDMFSQHFNKNFRLGRVFLQDIIWNNTRTLLKYQNS